MPDYSPNQEIVNLSLEELRHIMQWVRDRENIHDPVTVLIGGWAVESYNPHLGSVDIDLLTNNETKESLKYYLRQQREFTPYRKTLVINTVAKSTPYGEIRIDFGSREMLYPFEGREESLDLNICEGNTEIRKIRNEIDAVVPNKSLLLLFKTKAAWDRGYRIDNNKSDDPEWERSKLIKDYADILALLDPNFETGYLDIGFLGEQFRRFSFLIGCIETIPFNQDALLRYGRIDHETARRTFEKLFPLIE